MGTSGTTLAHAPFMVLGLDSGAVSGVALAYMREGAPVLAWTDSGKSTARFRQLWAENAEHQATQAGAHLLVVYERFFGKAHTIRGAAKQVGKWLHALELAGVHPSRCVEVPVSAWRKDVHGAPLRRSTDAWKVAARESIAQRFRLDIEHDAAEAACLAAWGLTAPAVLSRVPKRRRKPNEQTR